MSRKLRKFKKVKENNHSNENVEQDAEEKRFNYPLVAKTEAQGHYILSINSNKLTYGTGCAGTGKTFIAGILASDALKEKKIEKIIITRPAVEAGESFGFLPGEVDEKYEPYLQPFKDVLNQRLGKSTVNYMLKSKKIEAVPMSFMRGRSFNDCWVILDEAQNVTKKQMKMFLTRIGTNCRVIINGDPDQSDLPIGMSGLLDSVDRMETSNNVGVIKFTDEDCVRSGLVREVLMRYRGG